MSTLMPAVRSTLAPLLFLWIVVVVAVRFAEPIKDGDLFWHMAYARQMIERGSLILDHTAFSWTPTSNATIYCAWTSEFLLYGLWERFGAGGIFALRYLVIGLVLAMLWTFARRLGLTREPFLYLTLLVVVLASYVGTIVKPELFSLLFMHLLVGAYFRAKAATRETRPAVPWLVLVPPLLALWANSHGGFILAAPFLIATAVGEGLNVRFSRGLAMPRPLYTQLVAAWGACAVAVTLTPYGPRYPAQLVFDYLLGRTARPDVEWNAAHQSIFAAGAILHLVELLALMAIVLWVLLVVVARRAPKGERLDHAILLANAVYVPLYAVYLRSTYFLPAVFAYSAIFLVARLRSLEAEPRARIRETVPRRASAIASVLVMAVLGARAMSDARHRPTENSWLGFGISYFNPVAEAEFLAGAHLGPRLYNIFDSGGYLLWRLDPQHKVMTDSRSFPYLEWFTDQRDFTEGTIFEDFLLEYPADVAVIDLRKPHCWAHFVGSRDWRLVFYGPTAAVFVRRSVAFARDVASWPPDRFDGLRNAGTAMRAFQFAAAISDFAVAWRVLDELATRLRAEADPDDLTAALRYREAYRLLRAGDYDRAGPLFDQALKGRVVGERDALIRVFLERIAALKAVGKAAETRVFVEALGRLAAPE